VRSLICSELRCSQRELRKFETLRRALEREGEVSLSMGPVMEMFLPGVLKPRVKGLRVRAWRIGEGESLFREALTMTKGTGK